MDPGEHRSFYDKPGVHDRYAAHRSIPSRLSANHVMEEPAVVAEMGDPADLDVLDLGCGDATFGRDLIAAGARSFIGVDDSEHMVDRARATLSGTSGRVVRAPMDEFGPEPGGPRNGS